MLVEKQVAAQSQVIDAEIELEGLRSAGEVLLDNRVEPEELRAPTSGVIAARASWRGRSCRRRTCCSRSSIPASLWVEALVYGEIDPAALGRGDRTAPGGRR